MEGAKQAVVESLVDGRGLRVSFAWQRDRYAHAVFLVDGEHVTPLLASREGAGDQRWPPSPPLQQLSIEGRPDRRQVALLVGMAGKSHWSVSVEADSPAPQIVFDVACHGREKPLRLASHYQSFRAPWEVTGARVAYFRHNDLACQVAVEPMGDEPEAGLEITQAGIAVVLPTAEVPLPATFRWKYRVRLARTMQT